MWNLWHNVYFIKILTHCFWPKTNQHFLLALSYRLMGTAIPRRKNKPITQNWTSQHPFLEQARCHCKQSKHADDVGVVDLFYASIFLTMLVASISKHGLHAVFLRCSNIQQHVSDQWESSLYLCMLLAHIYYVTMILNSPNSPRCHWIIITLRHIHQCCKSLHIY